MIDIFKNHCWSQIECITYQSNNNNHQPTNSLAFLFDSCEKQNIYMFRKKLNINSNKWFGTMIENNFNPSPKCRYPKLK